MKRAKQRNKLKMGPVIVLIVLALVGAYFGINKLKDSGALDGLAKSAEQKDRVKKGVKTIRVGVCTWGGYAGGQYFNGGFAFDKKVSRFYKEYGLEVEFVLEDDPAKSLKAWENDDLDLHWYTADAFPTIYADLAKYDPKIVFQSDWSRGGDAIVATSKIKKVSDLKGATVAVALKTPSHSLLIKTLEANNMTLSDIKVVECATAIEASEKFQNKEVDAAVVWSPDDETCIAEVNGSKILTSTKDATNIIADVFFAKGVWVEKNPEVLQKLIKGWMTGNAELATESKKDEAAKILAVGLNNTDEFCKRAINNVRLATYGDNLNFFGLNVDYKGITGEDIYKSMGRTYSKLGAAPDNLPKWKDVVYRDGLRDLGLNGSADKAEPALVFATDTKSEKADMKKEEFASKNVTINFGSGASDLNDDSKVTIDDEVVNIIQTFGGVKVRIEGNTDNEGNPEGNKILSRKRAQAVASYLTQTYNIDPSKFVVVGNGPNNPVADNSTDSGKAQNRRTEIKFIK